VVSRAEKDAALMLLGLSVSESHRENTEDTLELEDKEMDKNVSAEVRSLHTTDITEMHRSKRRRAISM
jgi:hypothetical protein